MSTAMTQFRPGDAALTRLVKKLSAERGLTVDEHTAWNGYGYAVYRYEADSTVYEQAVRALGEKREAARAKDEERQRKKQEQELHRWQDDTQRRFPNLRDSIPPFATLYERWEDVPLTLNSITQWRQLGYRIRDRSESRNYLVSHAGRSVLRLFASYRAELMPSRYRRFSPERLWALYQSKGLSLVHAVWAANKLQKVKEHEKRIFYRLKDEFLRRHQHALVEGRYVRTETLRCWCDGEDDWCSKCDGTGIFAERTLYEHLLSLEGKVWSFHSYVRPKTVGDSAGADLPSYGRRLTSNEVKIMPFRLPEYIRMLAQLLGATSEPAPGSETETVVRATA